MGIGAIMTRFIRRIALGLLLATVGVGAAQAQFATQPQWGGTSSGSANAQLISVPNYPSQPLSRPGIPIWFKAGLSSTLSSVTLNIGGALSTTESVVVPGASGPISPPAGFIQAGQVYRAIFDGANYEVTSAPLQFGSVATLASGSTTDLGSVFSQAISVTGATGINSFGNSALPGVVKFLSFSGSPLLTYNSTSMILQGGQSILAQPNDQAIATSLGSGNWRVIYQTANGQAVGGSAPIAGLAYSVKLSAPTQLSSATFIAKQITLTNLGTTASVTLSNYSQTVNIATTGNGGMDTGNPPTNGFLDCYAIDNPTLGQAGITCANNATTLGAEVYNSGSLSAGATLSALLGTIPTDQTASIKPGGLIDRHWWYHAYVNLFTGATGSATFAKLSMSAGLSLMPPNARFLDVAAGSSTGATAFIFAGENGGAGPTAAATLGNDVGCGSTTPAIGGMTSTKTCGTFLGIPLLTPQVIWWAEPATQSTDQAYVSGYGW